MKLKIITLISKPQKKNNQHLHFRSFFKHHSIFQSQCIKLVGLATLHKCFSFFLKIQYTEKTLVFPILNHKLKTQE